MRKERLSKVPTISLIALEKSLSLRIKTAKLKYIRLYGAKLDLVKSELTKRQALSKV